MSKAIFTIGHSNLSANEFISILLKNKIDAIADVRSSPFSSRSPQFNQGELKAWLSSSGIRYVFLGKELGARSADHGCYIANKVQYDLLAKTSLFQVGINRLLNGVNSFRIALMCAEKEPLDCHRTILVARELISRGMNVEHILADGSIETHSKSIERLLINLGMGAEDFFRSKEYLVNKAYSEQADKIAYVRKDSEFSVTSDDLLYEDPIR